MALRVRRSLINPLLKSRHKNQTDLAEYLGVTQGFVSQLARGRASLTYEMAANIAAYFKVSMEELAEWDND